MLDEKWRILACCIRTRLGDIIDGYRHWGGHERISLHIIAGQSMAALSADDIALSYRRSVRQVLS
jgi:hypothetical protein